MGSSVSGDSEGLYSWGNADVVLVYCVLVSISLYSDLRYISAPFSSHRVWILIPSFHLLLLPISLYHLTLFFLSQTGPFTCLWTKETASYFAPWKTASGYLNVPMESSKGCSYLLFRTAFISTQNTYCLSFFLFPHGVSQDLPRKGICQQKGYRCERSFPLPRVQLSSSFSEGGPRAPAHIPGRSLEMQTLCNCWSVWLLLKFLMWYSSPGSMVPY